MASQVQQKYKNNLIRIFTTIKNKWIRSTSDHSVCCNASNINKRPKVFHVIRMKWMNTNDFVVFVFIYFGFVDIRYCDSEIQIHLNLWITQILYEFPFIMKQIRTCLTGFNRTAFPCVCAIKSSALKSFF